MSDLTERLRGLSKFVHDDFTIGDEAADEIERLTRELEDAKEAERAEIIAMMPGGDIVDPQEICDIIRERSKRAT